uniref:Solute carrier organic anion transporter family, member 1E1 n=1 Tax=Hippocampus comes TaxID=109280 RepID=A0A3Q2XEI8_HIPCM
MFIAALSFAYFCKTLAGTFVKSSITQLERRFDLSSSRVGLIDGSFELGNLLFLAVVSHFGAKMHRPRLIAAGSVLMAAGAFLTGLTHFFMGPKVVLMSSFDCEHPTIHCVCAACEKESSSNMWIYVFLGNALRGIGETPVTPLGISYIDDFAKAENSPFYIACIQTIALLGPVFGYLLGSYCANLYVDVGYVDMGESQFPGCIPFWFFPRSPDVKEAKPVPEKENPNPRADCTNNKPVTKTADVAKGFLSSLKHLLCNPTYFLLICGSTLKFNSLVGMFTFNAKYIEQQFGQSASRANFLIGVLTLPAVAVGIFLGGVVMKRYKLSVVSGAQFSFAVSLGAYLLVFLKFFTKCDNIPVAGLTTSYNGSVLLARRWGYSGDVGV